MVHKRFSRRDWFMGATLMALTGCAEKSSEGLRAARPARSPGRRPPRMRRRPAEGRLPGHRPPRSRRPRPPHVDDWQPVREHWAEFDLEPFHGTVQHLFIHQIIPFPHVAFASEEGQDFDDWYITRSEAVALLDELRARRYVLVSLADCFVPRGHAVVPNPELRVPRGHNPLVLSIDDLSFNRFLLGKGFMDRIIIDSTGHLSSIGKDPSTGRQFKEPTNCIVGLLDGYLRAHPEFSLNGAAATLALTGYEGILGY